MNKGFFKLKGAYAAGLIAFLVLSIISFTGPVRNSYFAGLSWCGWILAFIGIAVPVYLIILDAVRYGKK